MGHDDAEGTFMEQLLLGDSENNDPGGESEYNDHKGTIRGY